MFRSKHRNGKSSLPLLVTLTGCVLMFACLSPVNATEITKQLSVKGYQISRRNISELRVVVSGEQQAKHILESLNLTFSSTGTSSCNISPRIAEKTIYAYDEIFSKSVKRLHYEALRSWLLRE